MMRKGNDNDGFNRNQRSLLTKIPMPSVMTFPNAGQRYLPSYSRILIPSSPALESIGHFFLSTMRIGYRLMLVLSTVILPYPSPYLSVQDLHDVSVGAALVRLVVLGVLEQHLVHVRRCVPAHQLVNFNCWNVARIFDVWQVI